MSYLRKIKEEISFSLHLRREKTARRLGELSSREKRLYLFRNTLDTSPRTESFRS
ncbi:MAG: hypothetical protein JRI95_05300 [Deltaproteobacteria bacterium]|nr:hypothetical protein [Deltaproteobacteria bacterium]MBW2084760.1 hypothetical protein [Deltaproteobacteria bacterium]